MTFRGSATVVVGSGASASVFPRGVGSGYAITYRQAKAVWTQGATVVPPVVTVTTGTGTSATPHTQGQTWPR